MLILDFSKPRIALGWSKSGQFRWPRLRRPLPVLPRCPAQDRLRTRTADRGRYGRYGHIRTTARAERSERPATATRAHAPSQRLRRTGADGASSWSTARLPPARLSGPTPRPSAARARVRTARRRLPRGELWASVSEHDNANERSHGHAPARSSYAAG